MTGKIHITMNIGGTPHELVPRIGCKFKCQGCALEGKHHSCSTTDYWVSWGESELAPCKVLGGRWKEMKSEYAH